MATQEKRDFYQLIEEIYAQDARYKPDSYEFMMQALYFTQNKLKKTRHVSGRELSEGLREYAIEQFGPMAKTVLNFWGISVTEDFGNIVFNLIDKKILAKTEEDKIEDFRDLYDFSAAFGNVWNHPFKKETKRKISHGSHEENKGTPCQ